VAHGSEAQRDETIRSSPAVADASHAHQRGGENDFAVAGIADMFERNTGTRCRLLRRSHDPFLARPATPCAAAAGRDRDKRVGRQPGRPVVACIANPTKARKHSSPMMRPRS
jgi:hypothetical protein